VVTGCMAERYREDLQKEIPEIDVVLGTGEVPQIVDALGSTPACGTAPLNGRAATVLPLAFHRPRAPEDARAAGTPHLTAGPLSLRPTYIYDADTPRLLATPGHYAYIKIAEGCDYKCAFCIIPTLRGAYRSRPAQSIVTEARRLASQGVRELLLVSQDTTFYGVDRHERGALARLLHELNTIDGLEWIRLLYLYPTTIDEGTLDAIAANAKVCKYIDLPLQHASDPVLRRMKRPGTRRGYDRLLRRIRDRVPSVALRTTFIVGFPGETDADMAALSGFMTDHAFDHVGVFTYSHEEGTTAYDMADNVPAPVKADRRRRLMSLQKRLVGVRQRGRVGERTRVLVDGPSPDHDLVLKARLASQAPDIDPSAFLTDCDPSRYRPGDFVDVEIVGSRDYDLIVRPLAGIS
jgi:ribosomal protein S12 methylthiotransferase